MCPQNTDSHSERADRVTSDEVACGGWVGYTFYANSWPEYRTRIINRFFPPKRSSGLESRFRVEQLFDGERDAPPLPSFLTPLLTLSHPHPCLPHPGVPLLKLLRLPQEPLAVRILQSPLQT